MRIPEVPYAGPFDFAGPGLRHHVTQAGYGGPFVIRSNPFGAIIDAVRGFCLPAAMREEDGQYYAEGDGAISSPTLTDFPLLGDAGYSYGAPYGPATGILGAGCGPGTRYDPDVRQCIPESASGDQEVVSPCGPEALEETQRKLLTAVQKCDRTGIDLVRVNAAVCRRIAPKSLKPAWMALQMEAGNQGKSLAKRCRMTAMTARAESVMGGGMMAGASSRSVSPASLTEGNVQMRPSVFPMGGSLDPERLPETRSRRRGWGMR
jgi:hypothetical protein